MRRETWGIKHRLLYSLIYAVVFVLIVWAICIAFTEFVGDIDWRYLILWLAIGTTAGMLSSFIVYIALKGGRRRERL